jgi:hypothetical protein
MILGKSTHNLTFNSLKLKIPYITQRKVISRVNFSITNILTDFLSDKVWDSVYNNVENENR